MAKKEKNPPLPPAEQPQSPSEQAEERISIYEYQDKYVRRQNLRGARFIIGLFAGVIGVFIGWCLFSFTTRLWDMHPYAGYAAGIVSILLFIFVYIVPLVKILRSDYFITNVNSAHVNQAKRHNRQVRRKIAEKMIEFHQSVSGVGWYDDKLIQDLKRATHANDNEEIKNTLTALYRGKVKKTAKDIIFRSSLKSATFSAVSQSAPTDTLLVTVVNLQMIKDLIFLYGFRPSEPRLVKIFGSVIRNSLTAYGLGSMQVGNTVARTVGDAAKGIPFLGSAISAIVDSSIQGLTNGTLTAVIGFQTIRYLNKEYNLQNILDGVEVVETTEELAEACSEIKSELKRRPARPAALGA